MHTAWTKCRYSFANLAEYTLAIKVWRLVTVENDVSEVIKI